MRELGSGRRKRKTFARKEAVLHVTFKHSGDNWGQPKVYEEHLWVSYVAGYCLLGENALSKKVGDFFSPRGEGRKDVSEALIVVLSWRIDNSPVNKISMF